MLDSTAYATARAICDKANAYWQANATFDRSGWSSMSAKLSAHPDYAACTNAMRGDIEEYELHRDKPARFSAYVSESTREQIEQTNYVSCQRRNVTLWPGQLIGTVTHTGPWHVNNFGARWRAIDVRTAWGTEYYGREYDSMQLVRLRARKSRA